MCRVRGAQHHARRLGKISEGRNACCQKSVIGCAHCTLRTDHDTLIMPVPLEQARQLLSGLRQDLLNQNTADGERRQTRVQPEHLRALAWAIGAGRRFPYLEGVRKQKLISLGLPLCFVVPGCLLPQAGAGPPPPVPGQPQGVGAALAHAEQAGSSGQLLSALRPLAPIPSR